MDPKERPRLHARDHLPGGADPLELVFPTSRYSFAIINDPAGGLVLYWKLDELGNTTTDATDSSGNGHTGTYGASTEHPTLGVSALADGTSAEFDGVDDILGIDSRVPGINAFGKMSIEFWVKTTATTGAIVSADTGGAGGRFFKCTMNGGGTLRFSIFGEDASGHSLDSASAINDGLRHHIVCTFDGTTMKTYIDGALDASTTPSMGGFPLSGENNGFWIGSGAPIGGGFFQDPHVAATIDEVALYTVALPLDSIQTHFLIGGTASNPPSGPAGGDIVGNFPDDLHLVDFGPGAEGPIGDATHVAAVTIDDKGRVSGLSAVAISIDTAQLVDGAVTADKLEASPSGNDGKWIRLSSGALVYDSIDAGDVAIADAGSYFTSTDVEGALQEIGSGAVGGGGGGGGDLTLIAATTLAANASSIGIAGIPGSYRALVLHMLLRTNRANDIDAAYTYFNGDTNHASNYLYAEFVNNAGSSSAPQTDSFTTTGANAPAGRFAAVTMFIEGYDSTAYCTGFNFLVSAWLTGGFWHVVGGGMWNNTAVVTSIDFVSTHGNNFVTGSRILCYGLT